MFRLFYPFSNWTWNPSEDNDDDDDSIEPRFQGRDGIIYLVDAQNFSDVADNFEEALKCIEAGLLNGVLMNNKDLVKKKTVFFHSLFN